MYTGTTRDDDGCCRGRRSQRGVRLKRSCTILLGSLCLSLGGLQVLAVDEDSLPRPNVLFIVVDDLNDWVGCLEAHPQALTPHLDRLAQRGTLFSNAHCQAPLCNPSRASVLTGLRPSSTGIHGLKPGIRQVAATRDAVTLPQHFAQSGYSTACFGKVYHDGSIPRHLQAAELEVWGPSPGPALPPHKLVDTPSDNPWVDWGVFPEDDRRQPDWKVTNLAIEQLERRPKERPFFIAVGYRLPHVPCYVSQKWFDRLPPESEICVPTVPADDLDDVPFFSRYLHWKVPEPDLPWLQEAGQWRPLVRAYLACTTFMDAQVGRLLDALDAAGVAEQTIIVLWSDNGWHLGEKMMIGKNTLWERSTRVPLMFAGPGIKANQTCEQPAELLDLYPTLIELCRLPEAPGLEGHSLVPQLKNAKKRRRWPAITTHNQGNHTIRTDRWRYIRYADGSQELYDLRTDPNEWTNLAGSSGHRRVVRKLARWLPEVDLPAAPGSADRVLTRKDDQWYWEGEKITPEEDAK